MHALNLQDVHSQVHFEIYTAVQSSSNNYPDCIYINTRTGARLQTCIKFEVNFTIFEYSSFKDMSDGNSDSVSELHILNSS